VYQSGRRLPARACPVEEKAKIEICESDQRVVDFNSANFRLARQIALVRKLERASHTEAAALATKVLETIRVSLDMSKHHLTDLERRAKR
jgi:hypothetical protein